MTQKYATAKVLAMGMVMEFSGCAVNTAGCPNSAFAIDPLDSDEAVGHENTLTWNQQKQTTAASRQADILLFIFPYYNINFYSTNLRMLNSETQLHIKVIPPDPEVIVRCDEDHM